MTELEKQFEEATILVKTLKNKPDNKTLLELYSLYKVATIGVNNTSKPWYTIRSSCNGMLGNQKILLQNMCDERVYTTCGFTRIIYILDN